MAGEMRYLGIGEEGTFGQSVSALVYLDYLSTSLDAPSESLLQYEGAGSRGIPTVVPGPYIPSGDIELGMDPIEAVHFVKWALGRYGQSGTEDTSPQSANLAAAVSEGDTDVTVDDASGFSVDEYIQIDTGVGGDVGQIKEINGNALKLYFALLHDHDSSASIKRVVSPFTHVFAPTSGATLPSFTARVGKGAFEHVFSGATIDRLSFSVARGFLTCTIGVQASKDDQVELTARSKAFTRNIYTFRHGSTQIADSDRTTLVEGFALEISNNIDAEAGIRHGSRFPKEFPIQGIDVSGSLTLAFKDSAEYTRFWGAASGVQERGADSFKLEQQFRSGNDWLKFIFAAAHWRQISSPVSGRGRITQEIQFGTTDDPVWGPINVEAINEKDRY